MSIDTKGSGSEMGRHQGKKVSHGSRFFHFSCSITGPMEMEEQDMKGDRKVISYGEQWRLIFIFLVS